MRRKDLSVAKKANNKILLKTKKNQTTIYRNFRKKILNIIGKEKFAVGISGGPDSLCLAYLSKIYKSEFNNKIQALIVNHKIRRESTKESSKVSLILKKKGIQSKVLTWRGKKPIKNIQLAAREIRYALIAEYCLKNNIKYLLTAHHQDDQIENFFIRLFRGSGLKGLSSMSEVTKYNENLKIVRPLLNVDKEKLKSITNKYFKSYIKDPSNEDEKFLRTRVRKYRSQLNQEGLDTKKISKTISNLLVARNSLDFYKKRAIQNNVNFLSKNSCIVNSNIFIDEADEVIFRLIADILSLVSGSYYPPRSRKILNLIVRLKKKNFKKCTLGGCVLEKKDNFILVAKEARTKQISAYS
jgi:tRNA(Ile)-lysidine synthase